MRNVYSSAEQVLVWLFPPSNRSLRSFALLHDVLILVKAIAVKSELELDDLLYGDSFIHIHRVWTNFWDRYPTHLFVEIETDEHGVIRQILRWLFKPTTREDTELSLVKLPQTDDPSNLQVGSASFMLNLVASMSRKSDPIPPETRQKILQYLDELSHVFQLDWFYRIWVLQEVGSNNNITICHDDQRVLWEALAAVNFLIQSLYHHTTIACYGKFPTVFLKVTSPRGRNCIPLYILLGLTSRRKATDIRDTLFAQYGLMTELAETRPWPRSIGPDYSKSPLEIFASFTRWTVSKHGTLDILSLVRHYTKDANLQTQLPSWVARYGALLPTVLRMIGPYSTYRADGMKPARLAMVDDENTITLQGLQINTVVSVVRGPGTSSEMAGITKGKKVRSLVSGEDEALVSGLMVIWKSLRGILLNEEYLPATSSDKEVVARSYELLVLFIRCLYCVVAEERIYHEGSLMRSFLMPRLKLGNTALFCKASGANFTGLTWFEKKMMMRLGRLEEHNSVSKNRFLYVCSKSLDDRYFFTTSDQDFGLGPNTTKEGDIIAILDGGRVPYVLRERPYPPEMTLTEHLRRGQRINSSANAIWTSTWTGARLRRLGLRMMISTGTSTIGKSSGLLDLVSVLMTFLGL
jgi:hypothetical protein